jgi:hypothetical protein
MNTFNLYPTTPECTDNSQKNVWINLNGMIYDINTNGKTRQENITTCELYCMKIYKSLNKMNTKYQTTYTLNDYDNFGIRFNKTVIENLDEQINEIEYILTSLEEFIIHINTTYNIALTVKGCFGYIAQIKPLDFEKKLKEFEQCINYMVINCTELTKIECIKYIFVCIKYMLYQTHTIVCVQIIKLQHIILLKQRIVIKVNEDTINLQFYKHKYTMQDVNLEKVTEYMSKKEIDSMINCIVLTHVSIDKICKECNIIE